MPERVQVKKQNSKTQKKNANQSSVSSVVNIPTPTSPGRSGHRHVTVGWRVHDLSKEWVKLFEKYAGNVEEQGSVRFDWAHNGKKANGWIEVLSDKDRSLLHFQGAGWGSGRGSWKAHGEDLEVCFGTGRHILSLDGSEDRWVLKEKYSIKTGKAASNPGTAGWPTAKGEDRSQNKRKADEDAKQPKQKNPVTGERNALGKESQDPKKSKASVAKKPGKESPDPKKRRASVANKSGEDAYEPSLDEPVEPPNELKLWLHEGERGFIEAPACPGAKLPCHMKWGFVVPGMVSATLIIPPESWNEKETLAANRRIVFYVISAGDEGALQVHLNNCSHSVTKGDSIYVQPLMSWFITNESKKHEGVLRMNLIG